MRRVALATMLYIAGSAGAYDVIGLVQAEVVRLGIPGPATAATIGTDGNHKRIQAVHAEGSVFDEPSAAELSPTRDAAIDALFSEYAGTTSPGAAVSVYHLGKMVFSAGYGRADLEAGTPMTARTPIHVASVSKQFTAFAIALLARDGKVDLDADIRRYLPWVPDFGEAITPRHLILHSSGLRDQWSLFELGGQDTDGRLRQRQIINMVSRQQRLNFKPGTEESYSNTGYTLLAEIVRAVSGKTLREFTTQRIFKPLGMNSTFFFDDVTEVVPGRANSYSRRRDSDLWRRELLNYDNVGATSLFTTAEDMTKWAANFSQPVVGDRSLIEQITAPGKLSDGSPLDYAFGLGLGRTAGRTKIEHSGSDAGFRAQFTYFPEHDFAVIILANTPIPVGDKIARIAALYLPASAEATAGISVPSDTVGEVARLAALEGTYLTPHEPALQLEVRDGKLGLAIRRGEFERRVELTLYEDDSLDSGQRDWSYYKAIRASGGAVVALEQYTPKGRLVLRYDRQAAQPPSLSVDQLREYPGDYRSDELDVTYSIRLEQNPEAGTEADTAAPRKSGLIIDSLWNPAPAQLHAVAPDRFETGNWALGTLVFQRDEAGRLAGFVVHAGRIRNVRFHRVTTQE